MQQTSRSSSRVRMSTGSGRCWSTGLKQHLLSQHAHPPVPVGLPSRARPGACPAAPPGLHRQGANPTTLPGARWAPRPTFPRHVAPLRALGVVTASTPPTPQAPTAAARRPLLSLRVLIYRRRSPRVSRSPHSHEFHTTRWPVRVPTTPEAPREIPRGTPGPPQGQPAPQTGLGPQEPARAHLCSGAPGRGGGAAPGLPEEDGLWREGRVELHEVVLSPQLLFQRAKCPGAPLCAGREGGRVTHRAPCATPPRRKPRQGSSAVSQTRLTQQLQGAHRPFGARLPTPWRPAALLPQAQPAAWGSPRVLEPCFSAFKLRFCALQSPYESFAA